LSLVTTHVLDTARGEPAAGIPVALQRVAGTGAAGVGSGLTDADGRVRDIGPERLPPGVYRLVFAVAGYFASQRAVAFFPEVAVTFTVDAEAPHYHVPLLLSPFGYTTYRGS
jgi:5-hydroxyisourate hydrolase